MNEKPILWVGTSKEDLIAFPEDARRNLGFQLSQLQLGQTPLDSKPMKTIGLSVRELRVQVAEGIFRTICVSQFKDVIGVLHSFQKKSRQTSKKDLKTAKSRYKDFIDYMKEQANERAKS